MRLYNTSWDFMRHSWDFVILCDTSFFPWDFMIPRCVFCVYKAASILSVFPIPFPPVPCGYPGHSPYCDFHHVTSSLLWLCHHSCFSFSPLLIAGAGTNTIIICLILASLPLASCQFWDQRGLSCWVRRWLILRPEGMFNILCLWAILKTMSYVRLSYRRIVYGKIYSMPLHPWLWQPDSQGRCLCREVNSGAQRVTLSCSTYILLSYLPLCSSPFCCSAACARDLNGFRQLSTSLLLVYDNNKACSSMYLPL